MKLFQALVTLFAGAFLPLYADSFVVTTLADDETSGSFRSGIIAANGSLAIDTITFEQGVSGTITLTSDLPAITENLTITGPSGSESVTISGNNEYAYSLLPEIVTDSDPDGPVMVKFSVIAGKSEVRVMVPLTPCSNVIVSIANEPFAAMIPDLKDPEVSSSASVVTTNESA